MKKIKHFNEFVEVSNTSADILDIIEQFFVNEGVEVELDRSVIMTDKHERLVDTSVENNPTLITTLVPNVEVYSVFKRKEGDISDDNPLLYALKKEKKYKLVNAAKTMSRIEYIVKEFFKKHGEKEVTIMIPAINDLNNYFAKVVSSHCINPTYIDDIVSKMTIEEVDDGIFDDNSLFRKHYGRRFDKAYEQFRQYCKSMKGGIFKFHEIKDMNMRKVIEHTVKRNDENWGNYIDAFNGKDIIIVDDSITLGNTIKETCKIITDCYTPKSVTILTLLSPLYSEDGDKLVNL